ncbi:MAG TPA: hypothetical protein DCP62_00560 [Erysipelotrichaceae bacterium]|nr:hypothetical protein [Erysipelotrichaceae bacterium]
MTFRTNLSPYVTFIEKSIKNDLPVSFLVIDKGEEENLENQTWYTLVAIESSDDSKRVFVDVLSENEIKRVDLMKWYQTSLGGGGFVSSVLEK